MRLLLAALLSLCSLAMGAQTIAEQYHELLAKSKEVYKQAVGRETEMIPISGDQLTGRKAST